MSETNAEPTPAQVEVQTQQQTEQETTEVDWKAKAREWERRAKENKAAADKLTELEEAQKSAEQKAAERLAEAERRAAELEVKATRAEVSATSGIPANILAGPADHTPEGVRAFADMIAALIEERAQPRNPRPDLTQGGSGAPLALNGDGLEEALRSKLGIA